MAVDFSTLSGSEFSDTLTARTGTSSSDTIAVNGGGGSDKLYSTSGTQYVDFNGGADADVLELSGVGLTNISFEGDLGADELIVLANATGIVFDGGADAMCSR